MVGKKKKILSILLIFSMLMSLLSVSAYAGELDPANQQQIPEGGAGGSNSNEDVTISKTLEGTDIENVFDITLKVETPTSIESLTKPQPASVVLVMDVSFSMVRSDTKPNKGASDKWPGVTQYAMAKYAADNFIDKFCAEAAKDDSVIRDMAIVTFNTNADTVKGWTNCSNEGSAAELKDGLAAKANEVFGKDANNNVDPINGDYNPKNQNVEYYNDPAKMTTQYTNIEGGLQLANNLLAQKSDNTNKYIILLTDGFPTTYINGDKTSTTHIAGYNPRTGSGAIGQDGVFYDALTGRYTTYGTTYSDKGAKKTQELASAIKAGNTNIFTIGINIEGQQLNNLQRKGNGFSVADCYADGTYTREDVNQYSFNAQGEVTSAPAGNTEKYIIGQSGQYEGSYYKGWLRSKISSSNYYWNGNSEAGLTEAFNSIQKEIEALSESKIEGSWVVEDPMSATTPGYIEFISFFDKDGKLANSKSLTGSWEENAEDTASLTKENTIKWDLKNSGYEWVGSEDGTNGKYVYSIKYRVRLMNEEKGFIEYEDKDTNGETSLTYRVVEDGIPGEEEELDFPIPFVQGYLGELNFVKTEAADGASKEIIPVGGAEFTLKHDANCSVCKEIYGGNGIVDIKDQKCTSADNGQVSFSNIPSGHEYVLSETVVPAGYEKTADKKVVVAYDKTTLNGKSQEDELLAVENKKLSELVIKKFVDFDSTGDTDAAAEEALIYAEKAYTITVSKVGDDSFTPIKVQLPVNDGTKLIWEAKVDGLESGTYQITEEGGDILTEYGYSYTKTIEVGTEKTSTVAVDNGTKAEVYVTNAYKYVPNSKTVKAYKVWEDSDNQDGIRPYAVAFALFVNDKQVGEPKMVTVDAETGKFSASFVYDALQYKGDVTVKEVGYYTDAATYVPGAVPGYTTTDAVAGDKEENANTFTITNKHTPEVVDFNVEKIWADGTDGKQQDVTVRLYANGKEVNKAVLTEANKWKASFTTKEDGTPLYKYSENGKAIAYTLTEDELGSNWYSKVEESADGWVVTNSYYTPPTTTFLSVNKVWNDNDDAAKLRPTSVTVQLLKNGVVYDTKELNAANGWKTAWYALSISDKWTVQEVNVPEGYISSVTGANTSYTITNTYTTPTPPTPPITPPDYTPDEPGVPTGDKDLDDPLYGVDEDGVPRDYLEVDDSAVPKTADNTNLNMWLMITLLSGVALAASTVAERRRNKQEK